jgi:hypothetical protein
MVGGSDEYDGTMTGNIEGASRANLSKESVDGVGPDEEEDIVRKARCIKPVHQGGLARV